MIKATAVIGKCPDHSRLPRSSNLTRKLQRFPRLGVPPNHPFEKDFPYRPSSYWGSPIDGKKAYTTDHGFRNSLWATSPAAFFFSPSGDGQLDLGESALHDEFQYRTRASLVFFFDSGEGQGGSLSAEKSSHLNSPQIRHFFND